MFNLPGFNVVGCDDIISLIFIKKIMHLGWGNDNESVAILSFSFALLVASASGSLPLLLSLPPRVTDKCMVVKFHSVFPLLEKEN